MRIVSLNANGIRAAARKGFFDWLRYQRADFVCIQETKAQIDQLQDQVFHPAKYHCFYHDAERKGYSGTALYSRMEPDSVIRGMGHKAVDQEGRYLEVRIGKLSVISVYLPSGSSGDVRQNFKLKVLKKFQTHLESLVAQGRELVVCGDWNLARSEADIRNWRGNLKSPGFTPEERAWIANLVDKVGFVDAFRELPQKEHQYTWWSNRGGCWDKNVGWRIDYQVCSPDFKDRVRGTRVYRDKRFSDHAPLIFDYDYPAYDGSVSGPKALD